MTQIYAPSRVRRGLTLVEMLVATTLTLILFFSVAQIFAFLGDTMHDARSTIELSGNLRGLTTTMQSDLDCHTAPGLPLVAVGANQGYFTVIEGPDRDGDYATYVNPSTTLSEPSVAGDADDIIAFTAYSKDQPFVGLINGQLQRDTLDGVLRITSPGGASDVSAITSHYAEIIYWTEFTDLDDTDGDGVRGPHETVTLFRRVLLIRPDIDFTQFAESPLGTAGNVRVITHLDAFNNYDLSVRPLAQSGGGFSWGTNSLENLQDRRNRHGSWLIGSFNPANSKYESLNINTMATRNFPYPLKPTYLRSFETMANIVTDEVKAGGTTTNFRDRTGEDLVMSNVLAFDMKVFDPRAPILVASSNDLASIPGDAGFDSLNTGTGVSGGTGAYVDLNWSSLVTGGVGAPKNYDAGHFYAAPSGKFLANNSAAFTLSTSLRCPSMTPGGRSMVVYDTFPMLYESDGVNQDWYAPTAGNPTADNVANDLTSPIDEGTNGIDDDNQNGVDDPGERETAPPYDRPLRGIQITIRAVEKGSRLIRQDTVTANLMTE